MDRGLISRGGESRDHLGSLNDQSGVNGDVLCVDDIKKVPKSKMYKVKRGPPFIKFTKISKAGRSHACYRCAVSAACD